MDITHEQIDEMETGREMDALVDELVMGATLCRHEADENGKCIHCGLNKSYFVRIVPPAYYSTDIAAAWQVVEKITELPRTIEDAKLMPNTKFRILFEDADLWAMTAPEASESICRAALKAVTND